MSGERLGEQAQFIAGPAVPTTESLSLQPVLEWVVRHLAEDLTVAGLAAVAGLSTRALLRRFRAQTGTAPLTWVTRQVGRRRAPRRW